VIFVHIRFILTIRAAQVAAESAERVKGGPSSASQPEEREVRVELA
jgi:hypothetical protein